MNTVIEIHDSIVAGIAEHNGTVIVHFLPAYLHKSEGQPAYDSGTGWVQEAKLFLFEASVHGHFADWPCSLMDGDITMGGHRYNDLIPVPLQLKEAIELRLVCDSIHTVTITGRRAELELVGEARYVEQFSPNRSSFEPKE